MAPKVDVPLSLIKTAALSGIGLVWITVKAFKMAWNIISTSPEEGTLKPVAKEIVICEECQEISLMTKKNLNMESSYVRLAAITN